MKPSDLAEIWEFEVWERKIDEQPKTMTTDMTRTNLQRLGWSVGKRTKCMVMGHRVALERSGAGFQKALVDKITPGRSRCQVGNGTIPILLISSKVSSRAGTTKGSSRHIHIGMMWLGRSLIWSCQNQFWHETTKCQVLR